MQVVNRRLTVFLLILALGGLLTALELTRIHVYVHTDPSYHSICAISDEVNCDTVALSPYSVFAGLPVSVWGALGYLMMAALAVSRMAMRTLPNTWPLGLYTVLTGISLVTSIALATVSATLIGSFCLFCTLTYVINACLFTLTVIAVIKTHINIFILIVSDLKVLVAHPLLTGVFLLLGAGVLASLYGFVPSYWETPGWSDLPKLPTGINEEGHHFMGALQPKVTIVEFSDYECPHCRSAHKAVRQIVSRFPDKLRLVHRHLPLDKACNKTLKRPFHTRACEFAEAAECAGRQGRFWDMNDALFSAQEGMKSADVDPETLAVRLGLDRTDFKKCMENHETTDVIAADIAAANALNLTGTPSFIVEGKTFLGSVPESELQKMFGAQ